MFKIKTNLTINQLVSADLFLGYHLSNWNPKINYFLLGSYRFTNLFNLNYTYFLIKKNFYLLVDLFLKKSSVWLVNENFSIFYKNDFMSFLNKNFREIYFFNFKWYKGLLSNYKYVKAIRPFQFPHIIITPNVSNNFYCINESFLINIPSISLIDTIDNPSNVFSPIPGNSKSIRSLFLLYLLVAKSCFYSRYFASSSFIFSFIKKLGFVAPILKDSKYFTSYVRLFIKDNQPTIFNIIFYSVLTFNKKNVSRFSYLNKLSTLYYLNNLFLSVLKLNYFSSYNKKNNPLSLRGLVRLIF